MAYRPICSANFSSDVHTDVSIICYISQRQILRAVPVTEIDYSYKKQGSKFWVYGLERKVHSPDYPEQCCCGCNIL